ncbi:MAG: hypothetical protein J1E31_04620 [Helicobacter sp.]|nr:hypothetical protein [Helicobacter sp.]
MSVQYLKDAIEDVNALIAITKEDIEDIKIANHNAVFARMAQKEELANSFIHKKDLYAKSLESRLRELFPHSSLGDLCYEDKLKVLGEESSQYTAELHDRLEELKELNHRFGRMALAVCEFYSSLLKQMIPSEDRGYKKSVFNTSILTTDA